MLLSVFDILSHELKMQGSEKIFFKAFLKDLASVPQDVTQPQFPFYLKWFCLVARPVLVHGWAPRSGVESGSCQCRLAWQSRRTTHSWFCPIAQGRMGFSQLVWWCLIWHRRPLLASWAPTSPAAELRAMCLPPAHVRVSAAAGEAVV